MNIQTLSHSMVGILLLVHFVAGNAEAKVIRVSTTGDGSDPSTWEGALSSVGAAVNAATAGDEIWVASGLYNESIQMKAQVSMFGGFPGLDPDEGMESRDWRANETILDASGLNDRVIEGANKTILDGFTLTGGRRLHNENDLVDSGSGMRCLDATMEIRHCYFHHNGSAHQLGMPVPSAGGGIFCIGSSLRIEGCVFLNNNGGLGGAIYAHTSGLMLINCILDQNRTGAIESIGSDNIFINTTFGPNNCCRANGHDFAGSGSLVVYNCIARGNWLHGPLGPEIFFYSNVKGIGSFNNNIDADPLFVDPENGDYRLQLNSPCIDAGTKVNLLTDLDGNPRPIDVAGRGHEGAFSYDMGAYEFQLKKSDLDKNGKVDANDLLILQQEWKVEN